MRCLLGLDPITFSNFFGSATFVELAAVGETVSGGEAVVSPDGLGRFDPFSNVSSVRGRRGSDQRGYVGPNDGAIDLGLDGTAKSCSLAGTLLGSVDPELRRCEAAGPRANLSCSVDADCGESDECSDGVCNCLDVEPANVTLALALSGTLVNQPPKVDAGPDQTVECNATGKGRFTLAASASDPDGNIVLRSWLAGGRLGPELSRVDSVSVEQAVGTTSSYVARVIDARGQADEDSTSVAIVDTTAPQVFCNAPPTITPPSTAVSFTATTADVCDASVPAQVTGFECFRFNGAGRQVDYTGSCRVSFDGGTLTLRNSNGVDHHVRWTLQATDDAGNVGSATCETAVTNH